MKLHPSLCKKEIFTLLTAPVAKGKTRSVLELYQENVMKVVFISPLRALANEIKEKLITEKNIFLLGEENSSITNIEKCVNFLTKKKAMLITTVELLEDEFLDFLSLESDPILFVLDEFHLFYFWGDTFRPILHDKFLGILNTSHPVLAISATMNDEIIKKLSNDLTFYTDTWVFINYGNLELYRHPSESRIFLGHDKLVLDRAFRREIENKKRDEVFLYFCPFRQEVDQRVAWANRNGFRALGCVGGEVVQFQRELQEKEGEIDCIFSTIALSHGVNLPEIKKVFIGFEVKNYDLWLQMIGRGGRMGSEYQIYTFDNFENSKWEQMKQYWKIKLEDVLDQEI